MDLTNEEGCVQVYWLHLPYLKVARAALSCEASMTALLYAEEWCKEQHGCLTIGPPPNLLEQVTEAGCHCKVLLEPCGRTRELCTCLRYLVRLQGFPGFWQIWNGMQIFTMVHSCRESFQSRSSCCWTSTATFRSLTAFMR